MTNAHFRCLLVNKDEAGLVHRAVTQQPRPALAAGDLLVRVAYSALNYKDALSATGHPGVTKKFPHVPGIDAAGIVLESNAEHFRPGDRVLATSFDLGMNTWGGFGELLRVPAQWTLPVPTALSLRDAMILGTAGLTAGLAVVALQSRGVRPESGDVVVTGATGGVGSMAVSILARNGYRVSASTGKTEAHELLRALGATTILPRSELDQESDRPLLAARFAGAVDCVGGRTLSTLVRSLKRGGVVAATGLTGGADLKLTVYPFILRAVDLVGIDSADCPLAERTEVWDKLAGPWRPIELDRLAHEVQLEELEPYFARILAGQVTGRVLVRLAGE